jgi:hypothetical protein
MANVNSTARIYPASATTPNIYNLSMPVANTEYSQALSAATKKIMIKTRDRTATIKVAFISGDTTIKYFTIQPGAVYFEENLNLDGIVIYLQTNKTAQIAEILEWQ